MLKKISFLKVRALFFLLVFLLLGLSVSSFAQYDLIVAQNGSGNHTTVQAAINATPTGLTTPFKIFIKNGKYREKITVPSNKPFIQLIGESVANVIVYYDDPAIVLGTQNSASFTVNANDFSAFNITFANTYGDGSQAVAILLNADRSVFKNCRFLGNQDTVYTKGSGTTRHYFKSCYIDGNVDFIFGSSVAVFDSCVVYAKTRTTAGVSYITAANTPAGQTYGYVFRDCLLPANTGGTNYFFGRPWQNSTGSSPFANNKTVFLSSRMSSSIRVEGWSIWDAGTNVSLITNAEFSSKFFNGTDIDVSQRVSWSQQLNNTQAATYTLANIFAGWDPCLTYTNLCTSAPIDIAVSNFRVQKGVSLSTFNWNISWAFNQLKYELFRSTNLNTGYSKVAEVTSTNDTAVNFQLTDPIPPSGSIYYYYLQASKIGFASQISSDTVSVSSAPTITTTGTLNTFFQSIGSPSATQIYTVAGTDLSGYITVTPPSNFEISLNNTTWFTNSSPLVLTPVGNALASTTINVRLNALTANTYTGNIVHTSASTNTVNVSVNGNATNAPSITSTVLHHWPFTTSNSDSANARAIGVLASTQTFRSLFVSNGTTLSSIPAYSNTFGQAYGASSNGDGTWTTAVGGPGGNLNRNIYQQYTVTAATGFTVRVDSILLTSAFYNTSSNTRLAIVYSKSNFVTDSADVAGGTGLSLPLANNANGGFLTPISLANQTGGPTNYYALTLTAAPGGVTLNGGETLTIRLYNSCGSTGTPRYAMIKNVLVKGQANAVTPLILKSFTAELNENQILLNWHTTNEINVDQFIIEKSNDGINFFTLKTVAAKNNVNNTYSLLDPIAIKSLVYYRLKIIEKDGSYSFSKIAIVRSNPMVSELIYPNPATDIVTLSHKNAKLNATIRVLNFEGKIMFVKKVSINATQSILPVSNLSPGNYIVIFNNVNVQTHFKFIKQ